MVTCSSCGYEKNKDDKKFCIKCGKPLVHTVKNEPTVLPFKPIEEDEATSMTSVKEEQLHEEKTKSDRIVCSNCGYKKNKEGRKFCIKCGKQLAYTAVKEAAILPFEPIPDEEEEFPVLEQAEELHEEVTEEVFVPEQAEDLSEEAMEEISVSEQAEELPEEVTEEIHVSEQAEELPEEVTEEISVLEQAEELPKKKRNLYLKYVIALIVVLLILGVLIIALIPDREDASELNNAEITTSDMSYEEVTTETSIAITAETTESETTATTTVPETTTTETTMVTTTVATTEKTTTVPTTTVPTTVETTTTPITTVLTTVETTTIPTTTVPTTIETTTVPATTTATTTKAKPKKTTATTTEMTTTTEVTTTTVDIVRELITPLDQVPAYERVKNNDGGYVDVLEYNFVLDETVVGDWVSVDFVYGDPSEYDPSKTKSGIQLFLRSLTFNDDGTVIEQMSQTGTTKWTCGLVYLNNMISSYELWNIEGEEYLFYEWKSGDYSFRGQTDCPYYVLKRK